MSFHKGFGFCHSLAAAFFREECINYELLRARGFLFCEEAGEKGGGMDLRGGQRQGLRI